MNDPTDLPFDRVPLSGSAGTLPGPKASLDDLLAGSALLPPSRAPVSVSPPTKPAPEPPKPAVATGTETAPPPEPRWVKEALVTLLTPTRRKVVVLSSAAALAAGALAVNVLFSGKDRTPPTNPAREGPTVAAANPTPPAPEPTRQPDPTPTTGAIPVVPPIPVADPPIPSSTSPGGTHLRAPNEIVVPPITVVTPAAVGGSTGTTTNGYGGGTAAGGYAGGTGTTGGGTSAGGPSLPNLPPPGEPYVPGTGIVLAGATDPVTVPTPPVGGTPGPNPAGQSAPVSPPGIPVLPPGGASGVPGNSTPASTGGATGSAGGTSGTGLQAPTGLPEIVKPAAPTQPAGVGGTSGTGLPPADLSNLGTGGGAATRTQPSPTNDHRHGGNDTRLNDSPATLRFDRTEPPGAFTLTKQPDPVTPVRSTEPARTDFDLDLHEPKAGETYATISKLHYGDAKYTEALRAFNRGAELGRAAVEVPPMYVLRKRYPQLIGRPGAADTGRDRGTEWNPSSK